MAGFLNTLKNVVGIAGGGLTAADDKKSLPDRIMGGVGAVGTGLGWLGSALAPGLSATATSGFGALGGMGMGELGATVVGAGEAFGAGAGIGTAAVPAAAVLGSAALGYGAGRLLDNGVGQVSRMMGGDGRSLSDRIGDGMFDALGPGPGLWLADHLPSWAQ